MNFIVKLLLLLVASFLYYESFSNTALSEENLIWRYILIALTLIGGLIIYKIDYSKMRI